MYYFVSPFVSSMIKMQDYKEEALSTIYYDKTVPFKALIKIIN